jgi:PEGA domain
VKVRIVLFTLAIAGSMLATSCASIVAGGPTIFTANSRPAGAIVTVKGINNGEQLTGETPTTFTLDKGSDYELTFELAGYKSEVIVVRRTINGWFWGNFLLGIVPMVIDAATNNMWNHTITVAEVNFESQDGNLNDGVDAMVTVLTHDSEGNEVFARVPVRFFRI